MAPPGTRVAQVAPARTGWAVPRGFVSHQGTKVGGSLGGCGGFALQGAPEGWRGQRRGRKEGTGAGWRGDTWSRDRAGDAVGCGGLAACLRRAAPSPKPPLCQQGPWELLVPCAEWHHGGVWRGQKSLPSLLLPSPGHCLSNTFPAYLPTPREPRDEGRGAPPPHVGQRPAWHCPPWGLDHAKSKRGSPGGAAPTSPGAGAGDGDRLRAHVLGAAPCRSGAGPFLSQGLDPAAGFIALVRALGDSVS